MNQNVNMNQELIEENPFIPYVGIQIATFEEGNVVTELPIAPFLLNRNGVVHGGVFATMLDTTIALTARSNCGFLVSTINLNINYLANISSGKLIATSKILQQGYRFIIAEGQITDENGNVLATGSGTFKILRKET